jgi:hypothetical protein
MSDLPSIELQPGEVLVLRTCDANLRSHGGFQWPGSGLVECPDWDPKPACGNGLHGLLRGAGGGKYLDWSESAKWLLVAVIESECVDIGDKVKFARGRVMYVGDRKITTDILLSLYPGKAVVGIVREGGDRSTITGGDRSTITGGYGSTITGGEHSTITGGDRSKITGGYYSTITGGYYSTITGGNYSTITGGDHSKITGGNYSTITGGDHSKITGGDYSTITGGDYSTITGGDYSKITGGEHSTITGGDRSTITGGDYSTITGGDYSCLAFRHWDGNRYRMIVEYVGENGIKPNVAYHIDDSGKVVEVKQ